MTRVGGPGGLLKVRVEIDKLENMKLKISDLFGGRKIIGNFLFIHFLNFFQKLFELWEYCDLKKNLFQKTPPIS